jgi:5-methyltetrahydropteroyltriglutamate--homocysteine methyltransferase
MKLSTDRILTTHVGSLPRPDELREMLVARDDGAQVDNARFSSLIRDAVDEAVREQVRRGIDSVNDGEESKRSWSTYARERLGGHEARDGRPPGGTHPIFGRDLAEFAEYFEIAGPGRGANTRGGITGSAPTARHFVQTGPVSYVGQEYLQRDLTNLTDALKKTPAVEGFMSAVSPGTIEHWLINEHYKTDEEFVFAIAEAMREEYEAIVNAGFVVQIDDPDLADAWQIHPEMDVATYRKYAEVRIEALNHALRNIDPAMVRLHVCWGSYHGPHKYDIEMSDVIDIVLKTRAQGFAVEASNARHAHDWAAWQDAKATIPDGTIVMPGVVGHDSDFIEHPQLVADRIEKYASIVGRENVVASTDCGLGPRVGHATVAWAKFDSLVEGARIATKRLWG